MTKELVNEKKPESILFVLFIIKFYFYFLKERVN